MSQGDFLDWLEEDYGDRRVQRRLESELQDAYSYQARETSALRSQMAQVQGSLEQRLTHLTEAFYAFVELSDLRAELAVFEDEATVRHVTLRLLRALLRRASDPAAEVPPLPAGLPACRGYWLRPAVQYSAASVAGDTASAAAALAAARELDRVRPAVFGAATLAVAGQAALAAPLLADALQQPGERVTYAQRALWRACAHGVYGDAGAALIRQWLGGYVAGLGTGAAEAEATQWYATAGLTFNVKDQPAELHRQLPHALAEVPSLSDPLVAARELSALAAWVREAATGEPATTEPAGTSGTAGNATGDDVASASAGAGSAGTKADAADPVAALGAVAAALTEEGSPEEIALARRARELREIIDDRKTAARPAWDDPQNATLAVLREDAFGPDPRLRRLALGAGAAWVTAVADRLLAAARLAPPEELKVWVEGYDVQVSATGQASLQAAFDEIEQGNEPQNISGKLFGKKHAAEETAREQQRLTSQANEVAARFAARVAELRAAAQQAEADHETVTAALS